MTPLEQLRAALPGAGPIWGDSFRAPCPVHGGRSQTLSVRESDGAILLRCHAGCVTEAVVAALGLTLRDLFLDRARPLMRTPARRSLPAARPAPDPEKFALARNLWRESRPLAGTLGEAYLRTRGVPVPPADGDLRFHPAASVFRMHGPALIGRVSEATDARRALGVHVTWLSESGGHPGRRERRYVGSKRGGVVRLWSDTEPAALGVGEGIETTLALHALACVPVWACMDASNLETFPALPGIEVLHVAVDRDRSGTGQRAALAVAERWQRSGRTVVLHVPETVGADLADLSARAAA